VPMLFVGVQRLIGGERGGKGWLRLQARRRVLRRYRRQRRLAAAEAAAAES